MGRETLVADLALLYPPYTCIPASAGMTEEGRAARAIHWGVKRGEAPDPRVGGSRLRMVASVSTPEREDPFDFASPEWYIPQLRGVAQRLARMVWDHEAGGSNPLTPTRNCHPRIPKLAQYGETVQST